MGAPLALGSRGPKGSPGVGWEGESGVSGVLIQGLGGAAFCMAYLTFDLFSPCAGTDVVIVKSGRRICGTGGCLANAPLHQNKSYFEFKIQSTG